jgi:hypothetical protein
MGGGGCGYTDPRATAAIVISYMFCGLHPHQSCPTLVYTETHNKWLLIYTAVLLMDLFTLLGENVVIECHLKSKTWDGERERDYHF